MDVMPQVTTLYMYSTIPCILGYNCDGWSNSRGGICEIAIGYATLRMRVNNVKLCKLRNLYQNLTEHKLFMHECRVYPFEGR
jgi:hypothetical protein